MIDLTQKLLKKYPSEPGVPGRYSCSKIWAMLNGYLTPEQYIEGEEKDFTGAVRMWQGTMKHEAIQELMDGYHAEAKLEKEVKDFRIVGMADCINDNEILEIKTSEKVHPKAKPWAIHQLKLYLTLFQRPSGKIVQPIKTKDKLYLKVLGEYKRNDDWFDKEMDKLAEFHNKVMEITKGELEQAEHQDEVVEEGRDARRQKEIDEINQEISKVVEEEKENNIPF